jgi:hypothetical protein
LVHNHCHQAPQGMPSLMAGTKQCDADVAACPAALSCPGPTPLSPTTTPLAVSSL